MNFYDNLFKGNQNNKTGQDKSLEQDSPRCNSINDDSLVDLYQWDPLPETPFHEYQISTNEIFKRPPSAQIQQNNGDIECVRVGLRKGAFDYDIKHEADGRDQEQHPEEANQDKRLQFREPFDVKDYLVEQDKILKNKHLSPEEMRDRLIKLYFKRHASFTRFKLVHYSLNKHHKNQFASVNINPTPGYIYSRVEEFYYKDQTHIVSTECQGFNEGNKPTVAQTIRILKQNQRNKISEVEQKLVAYYKDKDKNSPPQLAYFEKFIYFFKDLRKLNRERIHGLFKLNIETNEEQLVSDHQFDDVQCLLLNQEVNTENVEVYKAEDEFDFLDNQYLIDFKDHSNTKIYKLSQLNKPLASIQLDHKPFLFTKVRTWDSDSESSDSDLDDESDSSDMYDSEESLGFPKTKLVFLTKKTSYMVDVRSFEFKKPGELVRESDIWIYPNNYNLHQKD